MKTLDEIKARDKIIEDYASHLVNSMNMNTLCQFAFQIICENLEKLHEDELLENVEQFAPHLLDSTHE
jgi:hypothetical protein